MYPARHYQPFPTTPEATAEQGGWAACTTYLFLYPQYLKKFRPRNKKSTSELVSLDKFRYEELRQRLNARRTESWGWLDGDELFKLMEWKLTRGSPRPKLLTLIASNDDKLVRETTTKAFNEYRNGSNVQLTGHDHRKAMNTLCILKGVGPATASLILSVAFPDEVPFFADELLAWIRGWKTRKDGEMKYNMKEYEEIIEAVRPFLGKISEQQGNLHWSINPEPAAFAIEKVAWVVLQLQQPDMMMRMSGDGQPSMTQSTAKKDRSVKAEQETDNDDEVEEQSSNYGEKEVETQIKLRDSANTKRKPVRQVLETAASKRPRRK